MVGVYVVLMTLIWLIRLILFGMMARAVLSWFTMGEQTKIGSFLYVLTEPMILPIRRICQRFGWFQGIPFDMPFMLSSLLLVFVMVVIETALGIGV